MATSPEVVEDDLEDGELASSGEEGEVQDENDQNDASPLNRGDERNTKSVTQEDKPPHDTHQLSPLQQENRKRPFESPERDCIDGHDEKQKDKKCKSEGTASASDGEEGEIFSDDEEAAYYPQLVKKRDQLSNLQQRDGDIKSRSRSPFSHHDSRMFEESHYSDRGEGHAPRGSRYHRGQRWRDRGSSGRAAKNHPGSDLIGPPIRHDRLGGEKKWDESSGRGGGTYTPTLTLDIIESRLSRMLALLPTPKINQCLSLDEMNYPAPPQWYLKCVAAYNKRKTQKEFDNATPTKKQHEDGFSNAEETVGYQMEEPWGLSVTPPTIQQPTANHISPLFTPEDVLGQVTGHVTGQVTQDSGQVTHSSVHQVTGNLDQPQLSLEMTNEEVTNDTQSSDGSTVLLPATATGNCSLTVTSLPPTQSDTVSSKSPIEPVSKRLRKRSIRKRKTATLAPAVSKQLLVSIDLSSVAIGSGPPLADNDFNYDDYLDQLNNEEDESSDTSYDFRAAAADFWIDTQPAAVSIVDPLDEDFPSLGNKKGSGVNGGASLQSLVSQQSIDEMIVSEEGKDVPPKVKKGLSNLRIPRKKREDKPHPSSEKTDTVVKKEAEPEAPPVPLKPCKYFLNGHCIHGNSCQYSHSVKREKKREMCKFYLQDACDRDDCLFYHGDFPCKYFHTRHMCYHGDKCKFSHAPLNAETYDILMSVIEPNVREFVRYPPPPPLPPSHPEATLHHVTHEGLLGPMPNGPASQQVPPPQVLVPVQQVTPTPSLILQPVPFPAQLPPKEGNWPSPNQTFVSPPTAVPSSSSGFVPSLKANVPLSPSFDVSILFPDSHPQVLPHDLATTLRKVLLPTPTSEETSKEGGREEDDELELEYWQHEELTQESVPTTEPVPHPHMPHATPPLATPIVYDESRSRPPEQPHPPLILEPVQPAFIHPGAPPPVIFHPPPHHFSQPHPPRPRLPEATPPYSDHYRRGPSPPQPRGPYPSHTMAAPPSHVISHPYHQGPHPRALSPPNFHGPSPPHIRGQGVPPPGATPGSGNIHKQLPDPRAGSNVSDPRYSRQSNSPLHHQTATTTPQVTNISEQQQQSYTQQPHHRQMSPQPPAVPDPKPRQTPVNTRETQSPGNHSPVWGSDGTGELRNERLVHPRQKYSHLKIKPKTTEQPVHASALKKTQEGNGHKELPSLLQSRAMLDKPLLPQELFGTAVGEVGVEKISLFGSRQQVPDSPIPNEKVVFGEIKMTNVGIEGGEDTEDPLGTGKQEVEAAPPVPSYLTHLGLGEDESGVQIESAFGTLQARQRRLSELSSIISEDTSSSQPELPSSLADPGTPSNEPSIRKMFSFGTSFY